jgi:hypothetical protein
MPWQPERNKNSLSPHHLKASENFASRGIHDVHCVIGNDPPSGLLSMTPLGATKSSPYMPAPAAHEKQQR